MRYEAVLFDMDGTLLDTLEDLADAMNGALEREGFPHRTLAEYRVAVGDGIEALAERMVPEGARQEATVARCVASMRDLYRENWRAKTRPYDGVMELLGELAQRGVPMALLSNKPADFTALLVAHFFAGVPFRAALGSREGIPRKPHPQGALDAAEALGLPPGEIFYLGDTPTDMRTALGAGMFPAGALWGFRPGQELLVAGARVLLAHPREVLDHV